MHGRNPVLLLVFLLFQTSTEAAESDIYQYRFRVLGDDYTVNTLAEVHETLSQYGPYYEILELTNENHVSETLTILTFSAPPPEPELGSVYWYEHSDNGGGYELTFESAKTELDKLAAQMNDPPPEPAYSGVWNGKPYTVFGNFYIPANTIIDPSGPVSEDCSGYIGGGEIAYLEYNRAVVYAPSRHNPGRTCEVRGESPWALSIRNGYLNRILTTPAWHCPYGYTPPWVHLAVPHWCSNSKTVLVQRTRLVTCPVMPIKPLQYWIDEYHKNDPEMAQLTNDLEAGVDLSLRDMLTEATQQAESCVSAKFAADGFDYTLESTGHPKAYQAHFHDLYLRWLEHGKKVDEGSPEWEACAERREQVELEVGKRVGTQGKRWNSPGGRFHQINQAASAETSKHTDGRAFDVSGVDAIEDRLAQYGPPALTVEDWVNQPTDCNVGWGGLFTKPDEVHFYLREGEQQMEFIALIAALTAGMEPELPPDLHHGEPQWARLLVSGEHVDGNVVYHYTIVNQHPEAELTHVTLGIAHENGGAVPDLAEMPVGTEVMIEPHPTQPGFNQFWAETPESSWTAPPHWLLDFVKMEYFPRFYLEFWLQRASKQASVGEVQPGDQLEGFSIRLPKADPTYYETGFEASFYYPSKNYFGYPEKLDTTPPELFLSVDRPSMWPPNNKLVDINVDIDVTDDYDGQPAIKLVSITANEPLEEGDIHGAEFGADDRSFQLRASRDGRNREGRVYTITYEATDAMANVTQKSVEVIVPHDQRW